MMFPEILSSSFDVLGRLCFMIVAFPEKHSSSFDALGRLCFVIVAFPGKHFSFWMTWDGCAL